MNKPGLDLFNVFVQIPNFIFWKDQHSIFLGCNENFSQAAGLKSPGEIVGKTDYDLPWQNSHADLYRTGDQAVLDGVIMKDIIEPQLQSNGKIVHIRINKVPLIYQGKKIGVIGSYSEISNSVFNGKFQVNKKNIALTQKQSECLFYLAQGMVAKQIAENMGISKRTVESHLAILKNKLQCSSKTDLIRKALALDFIRYRLLNNKI